LPKLKPPLIAVWAKLGDAPLACVVEHLGVLSGIKDQLLKTIRYAARHNPDVRVETTWMTQQQMAELFQVDKSGISKSPFEKHV
jgi:hypothetical protein